MQLKKIPYLFMYSFIYCFIEVQLVYPKTARNYCIKFGESRHMYTLMLPSPQSRKYIHHLQKFPGVPLQCVLVCMRVCPRGCIHVSVLRTLNMISTLLKYFKCTITSC